MLTFEIINSSVIEFDVVIEVPANNVIEKINVLSQLPEGLTYAKTPGPKIRLEGTTTWIENAIVDNSTDVQLDEDASYLPSQLNLLLIGPVANPAADSKYELRIPAVVYDKSKLIDKEIINTVSMSSDFKNYISENIPIQFFDATLDLYASMKLHRATELPIDGTLTFCFKMLNSLAETDDKWYYEITVPITEDFPFDYPFKAYLHKTYDPLNFATDYTIRLNLRKQAYTIKIPHQNQYKDKIIFIEIPYTLNPSSNPSALYPYSIYHECTLELFNTDQILLLPISYACHQIKILAPLPKLKFNSITLK